MRACGRVQHNPSSIIYAINPVLDSDQILSLPSRTDAGLLMAANLYLPIRDTHHTR